MQKYLIILLIIFSVKFINAGNIKVIQVPNGMTDVKTSEAQRELNRLGREGWELVSVQGTRLYQGWMYLKRPLGSA